MELQVLRHRAVCRICKSKLPPRSSAWFDADTSQFMCESCHLTYRPEPPPTMTPGFAGPALPPVERPIVSEAVVESVAQSVAQGLRQSLTESLTAAEEAAAAEAAARSAALAAAAEPTVDVAPLEAGALATEEPLVVEEPLEPVASEVYFQGPPDRLGAPPAAAPAPARAEPSVPELIRRDRQAPTDEVGRVLLAAENRGLVWLGPRVAPDGTPVGHVAMSSNGIWLVGVEPVPTGRVERRDVGDWFTPEPRLFVGDQDRSAVIEQHRRIQEAVARAVLASPLEQVPRYHVMCFLDAPPGWLDRAFEFQGVWVTWSRHLVEPMLATVYLQRSEVARLSDLLARVLNPL